LKQPDDNGYFLIKTFKYLNRNNTKSDIFLQLTSNESVSLAVLYIHTNHQKERETMAARNNFTKEEILR